MAFSGVRRLVEGYGNGRTSFVKVFEDFVGIEGLQS